MYKEFINKVRETRFIKVKNRQVNKFNRLVAKSGREISAQSVNNSNQLQSSSNNNNHTQTHNINNKWVINLSNTPLTPAQGSLLAKGPNFAVAPKNPNGDYISAIESVCHKLTEQDVEELRADINGLLRRVQTPKPNLNKAEIKALAELRRDKDGIVLTADKGVAMVVLDKDKCIEKAENLLAQPAYRTIDRDPTNKLKAQLILKLRRIKRETNMDEGMYKTMYPTGCIPLSFMGYQKSIKLVPPQAHCF